MIGSVFFIMFGIIFILLASLYIDYLFISESWGEKIATFLFIVTAVIAGVLCFVAAWTMAP